MTHRKKIPLLTGLGASLVLIALSSCQGVVAPVNPNGTLQNSVNHIIFLMQENRSFDAYFGKLDDFRANQGLGRNADDLETLFSVAADDGTLISNFHLTTSCIFNTTAAWNESWGDMNRFDSPNGPLLLDGFVHTAGIQAVREGAADTKGVRVMGFYNGNDLPAPYSLATEFATSDRFYAPAPVQTEVVRLWSMAATSQGFVHAPAEGSGFLSATTIFQRLDAAGITWKIYSVDIGGDGKLITSLRKFHPYGLNQDSRIVPIDDYFTDLKNGTLPQFVYIEPAFISGRDEHPGEGTQIGAGAQFAAHLIDSLINSTSWKDSIFIETFDEGGGLFDHVGPMIDGQPIQALAMGPAGQAVGAAVYATDAASQNVPSPDGIPPKDLNPGDPNGDFTRTGFRVPLIIASPFSRAHFVSHTPMDYTAVLKLVEQRFNLPSLTKRDAAQPDMLEFFDFINQPNLFARPSAAQPTNMPCNALEASVPM